MHARICKCRGGCFTVSSDLASVTACELFLGEGATTPVLGSCNQKRIRIRWLYSQDRPLEKAMSTASYRGWGHCQVRAVCVGSDSMCFPWFAHLPHETEGRWHLTPRALAGIGQGNGCTAPCSSVCEELAFHSSTCEHC